MTEQEWLTSTDPAEMLQHLEVGGPGKDSGRTLAGYPVIYTSSHPVRTDRKLRLFACGCCRLVWPLLTDDRSRRAVEVAERYADGEATEQEREDADWGASLAVSERASGELMPVLWVAYQSMRNVAASQVAQWVGAPGADVLRCVFGNPWRPALGWNWNTGGKCYDLDWLSWKDGTIPRMAQKIYDSRDWSGLGPLADALEEAGCPTEVECLECEFEEGCDVCEGREVVDHYSGNGVVNCPNGYDDDGFWLGCKIPITCPRCGNTGQVPNPLLSHLRGEGPHCLGCWVVDLLLGKK